MTQSHEMVMQDYMMMSYLTMGLSQDAMLETHN